MNDSAPAAPSAAGQIQRHIGESARRALREKIAEYEGAEVYFVGRVDAEGLVESVEACAFGNADAVPVIESMARPGNVIIHNHPGGDLTPSQADIGVSSMLGNKGVGSFIIDNAAERLRIVVPVMAPREKRPLDAARLEALIAPDGALARTMSGFEHRPQQGEMLRLVCQAFNDDGLAVIEAGTGTGKSLAYLLPAVHWAKANDEKIVISTNTINLQEQLLTKDIPFLQRQLGLEFKAVILKGQSNYLCLRKSEYIKAHPDFFDDEQASGDIGAILEWAEKTATGNVGELSFIPDPATWERVAVDGDDCTRIKCPHYAVCHYFQARRRAAQADLIVVNHHLALADLALRAETGNYGGTAVLPPYSRLLIDEAHNLEDTATRYFGIEIGRRSFVRPLGRLVNRRQRNQGLLPFILNRVAVGGFDQGGVAYDPIRESIEERLVPARFAVAEAVAGLMDLCAEAVPRELGEALRPRRELKLRVTPELEQTAFWNGPLLEAIHHAAKRLVELGEGLGRLCELLSRLPNPLREDLERPAGECRALSNKMLKRATELRNFYGVGENQCRWIEVYQTREKTVPAVKLVSLPLEVQQALREAVFSRAKTVGMCSATLAVDHRFDYYLRQVGLDRAGAAADLADRVETLQLDTPFDYERQALVGVATDLPLPAAPGFGEAACELLLHALEASRGGAFLLFTSYRQLEDFHRRLAPGLEALGLSALRQGAENRRALLERFRKDRNSVLFATASFWEGVDVPGEALRLLALVKLPFQVPTDPLVQARIERLEERGADAFREFSLPQAVIRFKQGFGRLIRSREDYGAVLILDSRVHSRSYGRVFLNSLPAARVECRPGVELVGQLREFFETRRRAGG